MKKILIAATLCGCLFLAGCGKSADKVTFAEGYETLTKQLSPLAMAKPTMTPLSQDSTQATFTISAKQGFTSSGVLAVSGVYNSTSGQAIIDMTLDATLFEPSFNANAALTGGMRFVQKDAQMYAYINGVHLTATSGDIDGGIINALIGTISKKWIHLTEGQTGSINTSSYSTNLSSFGYYLIEGFSRFPLLAAKEKTTIDGVPAYALTWDNQGVSGFVHYILNEAQNPGIQVLFSGDTLQQVVDGILASPISGYLIVHSAKDIELRINSIETKDAGTIQLSLRTTKPATRGLIEKDTNTVLLTGKAEIKNKGLHISNTLTTQQITLDARITSRGDTIDFTLTTPDIRAYVVLNNQHKKAETFALPSMNDIMPLTQILQGFSMLGGGIPSENENTIPGDMTLAPQEMSSGTGNIRQ